MPSSSEDSRAREISVFGSRKEKGGAGWPYNHLSWRDEGRSRVGTVQG